MRTEQSLSHLQQHVKLPFRVRLLGVRASFCLSARRRVSPLTDMSPNASSLAPRGGIHDDLRPRESYVSFDSPASCPPSASFQVAINSGYLAARGEPSQPPSSCGS